uniref:Uncharacterized protein n=1 Tax=Setaria viridis TaxID=4556 RepID=A0A4U6TAY4_SETVI|nr:hypothetical protein SEVIR_9G534500v2 [Setaria viridis]
MVRAAAVAVLLLMQCCTEIVAARPLLPAAAAEHGGWQLGQGAGASILQVLDKSNVPSQPGQGNCDWKDPAHPKGCRPPPPK